METKTIAFVSGAHYEGEVNEGGQPEGQGILTFPDGARYEGQWRRGEPEGQGALTYPDGRRYEGEFRSGEPTGEGVSSKPDEAMDGAAAWERRWRVV